MSEDSQHRPYWVVWRITGVNRDKQVQFLRDVYADMRALPPEVAVEIHFAVESLDNSGLVPLRSFFSAQKPFTDAEQFAGKYVGVTVPGYFEDEHGKALDVVEYMEALTGKKIASVIGDVGSVARHGPSDMINREKWNVERANDIAHFLEVLKCLAASEWVHTNTSITSELLPDKSLKTIRFDRPNVLLINSVLTFIRQLWSPDDKIFKLAVDWYCCHTDNQIKRDWVQERRKSFNRTFAEKTPVSGLVGTGKDLLDVFLYGFGLIHVVPEEAQRFRQMIAQHGRESMVMEFNSLCQILFAFANDAAHVISQDFYHWLQSEQATPPDRISIEDLLGLV